MALTVSTANVPSLRQGEFCIDGYAFGGERHPIVIRPGGFDPGTTNWNVQDKASPVDDYVLFGRDYKDAPSWTFDVTTNDTFTAAEANDALEELASAWLNNVSRIGPGRTSMMYYNLDGRTRLVYGRPRRFGRTVPASLWQGVAQAVMDFKMVDPQFYSSEMYNCVLGPGERHADKMGGNGPVLLSLVFTGPFEANEAFYLNGERVMTFAKPLAAGEQIYIHSRLGLVSDHGWGENFADYFSVDSRFRHYVKPGTSYQLQNGGSGTINVSWRLAYNTL